ISEDFAVDGIYVSGNTYRTHPIQIFIEPTINKEDQILVKNYFNFMLETFRKKLDSEFLTTYKYSDAKYTRKYLGLTQVRSLLETFPIINMNSDEKAILDDFILSKNFDGVIRFLKKFRNKSE
ncbi:MAG: SAM-dependent DNA methyltransferase, partial [Promethearchaeota archaeon]